MSGTYFLGLAGLAFFLPRFDGTAYALRHTFASMESDAGVETTGLARLMGHSTTRTLERYVVNTAEHHLKGVTAVQDRIRSVVQHAAGDKTE